MEGGANSVSEIKTCVFDSNGKLINIGPWDDLGGQNPLPEGAYTEEREVEYDPERGWYEVGTVATPTDKERIRIIENALLEILLGGM